MRKIKTNVITPVSATETTYQNNVALSIDSGVIVAIEPFNPSIHGDCEDKTAYVCLPGLIDMHVHLSQFDIRGQYRPALLPWLNEVVFPAEQKSSEADYAESIAARFFAELAKVGTTTAIIYTAPSFTACQKAFEQAEHAGIRARIGMTLMDMNSPDFLLQPTMYAYEQSIALYDRWHGKNELLDYIFTPRFAPTCSAELMTNIGSFASTNGAWIQSHLSENADEIKWVKELFGLQTYTEVYEKFGILGPHTIMAHCIHLTDRELEILRTTETKIAHCPDSNFYLKSGEFDVDRILKSQIPFGLGSDVGAGTTLSMLYHAKMYNYRQSQKAISPSDALYHITLGAARALGMDEQIGTIESGKDADLIFIPRSESTSLPDFLSSLIFYGNEYPIAETLVKGHSIYQHIR